jgi:hypothetical protein
MHEFKITVQGRGVFPADMLRRDRCFPATEDDANMMQHSDGMRTVNLVHNDERKLWQPTDGRWESFGWRVKRVVHPDGWER